MTKQEKIDKLKIRLEEIETAISKALDAQSYGIQGRSKTMANLETLEKMKDKYEKEIAILEGTGGSRIVVGIPC